mmetsp:Transcript_51745/g.123152  ORF Transcript_51745/g.123152 Transcript_51745/m.123152 type:complete len:342 (+) Transcript_51745:115-1140(+)
MGQFFTVHSSEEWHGAVGETMDPSIWTNVAFSPLARTQNMFFERPGRVYYSFPRGMREGNDIVQVSSVAEVSMVVAVHETVGRFYAGVVFHALSPTSPHVYHRLREEATLSKGEEGGATSSAQGGANKSKSGLSLAELGKEGPFQESPWSYLLVYCVKEGVLVHFANSMEDCEAVVRNIAVSYGNQSVLPAQANGRVSPATDRASPCNDSSLEVTARPGRTSPDVAGPAAGGTKAVESLSNALRVKCASHAIGRAPGVVTRLLTEVLTIDLQRPFAVRCEAEDQGDYTNCIVFCMRLLSKMQLAVRGFDLRRVCESRADLGERAGEAASEAWEHLWKIVRD